MKQQVHEVISERIQPEQFVFHHVAEHRYRLVVAHKLLRKNLFKGNHIPGMYDRIIDEILGIIEVYEFVLKGRKKYDKGYGKD